MEHAQVLAEFTDGTLDVTYQFGDDLISQSRAGNLHYFHVDGLGSTRVLTNQAGARSDEIDYAAFGEVIQTSGQVQTDYLFAGEQYDNVLGLYYLRARYLDTDRPGFISADEWLGFVDLQVTGIQSARAGATQASFRVVVREIGEELACIAIEEAVTELAVSALQGGVYILSDGGKPYTGMTNDFDRRLKEHARNTAKNVEAILAKFHIDGDRNDRRLIEQFFIETFDSAGQETTNRSNSISRNPSSDNSKRLRRIVDKLDFC